MVGTMDCTAKLESAKLTAFQNSARIYNHSVITMESPKPGTVLCMDNNHRTLLDAISTAKSRAFRINLQPSKSCRQPELCLFLDKMNPLQNRKSLNIDELPPLKRQSPAAAGYRNINLRLINKSLI